MADSTLICKTWKSWIGQRVFIKKSALGTLKYFGEIKFKDGFWCGVELDDPVGENDGMINNVLYFKCKANHGIFVPMCETIRLRSASSEVNPLSASMKLKYAGRRERSTSTNGPSSTFSQNLNFAKLKMGDEDEISKKIQPRNCSSFNKTFYKNELKKIPDSFCFEAPKDRLHADFAKVKKYENVSKRSKNTCGSLETEESLGIISDLLDEEESWNLLDLSTTNTAGNNCSIQKSSDGIDIDSVFYPPAETSVLDSRPNFYTEQVDGSIKKCLLSKCTSTPKRCFNTVIDLNRTVNLNDKQSYDFLHDEPIVAGSSKLNFGMDFDLAKFKQSDILCSTLKCSLSSVPIQYSDSGDISCLNNDELAKSNKNVKYQEVAKLNEEKSSTISNECVNTKQFANIRKGSAVDDSDILNTTFIINSDLLLNPAALTSYIAIDFSPPSVSESNSLYSDRKFNGVIQMDSTFVAHDNFAEKILDGEKTFIVDCSPVKIPKVSSLKCETIPMRKTLSIIFEKANSENVSVDETVESKNKTTNKTRIESLISSKISSEDMDHVIKSSSSLSKIAASELNSTFCISSGESKNKKNTAYLDVKKRCSLSSISVKNNVCIKKEKSIITSLKANGQKSIAQSRLSVITKKKSLQSSTNNTSLLKESKDKILRDKNATEVSSAKKFLEMAPKIKLKKTCSTLVQCSSDIAYATKELRKSLGSCKSVNNLGVKEESASHPVLKINKTNSKVVERGKGVSILPTKVIPQMLYNYKEITSEYSNFNRKVNALTSSYEFNSKNLTDVKLGNFKHRHSMLPTFHAKSTLTKNSTSKDRNDVKCITNAVKSTFTENRSFPLSKIHQGGFGKERGPERKNTEKKAVFAEKIFENNSNNNIKSVETNENSTIPKSKLLKPRALSRLPVPETLSKMPDCVLNTDNPQSQHIIKRFNKIDNQRIYRRLPLQKLQDKH